MTLTLTFAGVCAHFSGVVPGVPHRVVLPDASALRFGIVTTPHHVRRFTVFPHFAMLMGDVDPEQLTIPGLMELGLIYSGVRMQLLNAAVGDGMTYTKSYETIPRVRHFEPSYEFSQEVVCGGRAACYFDLYGGKVRSEKGRGGALHVVVELETDGPPQLMITPFTTGGVPSTSTVLTLDVPSLILGNFDIDAHGDDKPYDFLLHYLTAQRGIPQILAVPTPGMIDTPDTPEMTPARVARALERLAPLVAAGRPSREEILAMPAFVLNPSCSDSRYP